MPMLGPTELIMIAGVALLLFGRRVPSVMRSLGKGIVEFKKGVRDIEDDIDEAVEKPSKVSSAKETGEKEEESSDSDDLAG